MHIKFFYGGLFFLLCCFLAETTSTAMANQPIQYGYKPGERELWMLEQFTKEQSSLGEPLENLAIAAVDLNEDGLNELIIRQSACAPDALCAYNILAETNKKFISLGQFQGKKILLGQDYTNGIRNLLVFNNETNDFDYKIYTWSAEASQYGAKP